VAKSVARTMKTNMQEGTPEERVNALLRGEGGLCFSGKRVLEIGPGYDCGLSGFVFELGASSYIGIDINKDAVELSRKASREKVPEAEFVFDDSLFIIRALTEPHIIISSGVFDAVILIDRTYTEELVRAISDKTPKGEFTIHSGSDFHKDFHEFFTRFGFKKAEYEYLPADFGIYRKL